MTASAERVIILSALREAKEFPTEKALRNYLKDHPEADKSKHTVTKGVPSGGGPEQPEPGKKQPPPIPDQAKKKKKGPPPLPEKGKKKKELPPAPPPAGKAAPPDKTKPEKPKPEAKPDVKPEQKGRLEAWRDKFKGLSDKAVKIVDSSSKAAKHFLGNEEFRAQALKEAGTAAKKAPKKLLKSLVDTAKHEVHEFQMAGKGIAAAMSGKKVSKKQKHAIRAVATHMAIAGTAAAFAASGPLAGAGLFGKAVARHIALKSVHKTLGHLHVLEELGHIGHGVVHLLSHIASEEEAKQLSPDQALATLVMAAVAKEIEGLKDEDLSQALEGYEEEKSDSEAIDASKEDEKVSDKQANRVAARFLQGKTESMGAWEGKEHLWPVDVKWDTLPEKRDAFGDVSVMRYEFEGRELSGFLTVEFDAGSFADSGGTRPGKWEASYLGSKDKGTWRNIDEIPRVLNKAVRWGQSEAKTVTKKVEDLGSPKWRGQFDGFEVLYDFQVRGTDASLTATLSELDEFLQSGEAHLEFYYSAGYDYEGNFGERQKDVKVTGGLAGLKRALQDATKLWDRWHEG